MRNLSSIFFGLLSVAPLALASGQNARDHVNPGDDETLGTIVAQAPLPAAGLNLPLGTVSVSYGGQAMTFGTPLRLTAGARCLQLQAGYTLQDCGVTIVQKQLTTYRLSGLVTRWNADSVAVDFGPQFEFSASHNDKAIKATGDQWPAQPAAALPLLEGTVRINPMPAMPVAGLDPVSARLAPGETQLIDLTPKSEVRARLAVQFDQADYPDANGGCRNHAAYLLWREAGHETQIMNDGLWEPHPYDVYRGAVSNYSAQYGIGAYKPVARTPGGALRFFPFPDEKRHYELVVNNMPVAVAARAGETATVVLRRIDVNDVKITQEDGVVYYAPGTYSVFRHAAGGPIEWVPVRVPGGSNAGLLAEQELFSELRPPHHPPYHPPHSYPPSQPTSPPAPSCSSGLAFASIFPTKTGLDVVPGQYKVVIRYATKEGPKTQEIMLDLSR